MSKMSPGTLALLKLRVVARGPSSLDADAWRGESHAATAVE